MLSVTRFLAIACALMAAVSTVARANGPHKSVYFAPGTNVVARTGTSKTKCETPVSVRSATAEYQVVVPHVPAQATRVIREQVMVPRTTHEKRTIVEQKVEYQNRPRTVTVMESVPCVTSIQRAETVMTTETRLQPQTQVYTQPVYRDIVEPVTVPVQGVQNRVGVRPVLRTVAVRVQVPMTKQCQCVTTIPGYGHQATCGPPVTQLVEQIQYRQQWCNEQFTYQVPVTYYQTQHRTRRVVEYRQVQQTVNVPVQVQVPRQRIRTEQVTQYRQVPRQVVQNETVAVPVTIRREVSVPVTRMVPQTVERRVVVPHCAPQPACAVPCVPQCVTR